MTTFETTLPGGGTIVSDGPTTRHHGIPGLTVFGIDQGLIGLETLAQAAKVAALPFVGPFMALMPDAHYGIGATIGSVIPTRGVVMPSAVGTDIGCGVYWARLDLTAEEVALRANELLAAMRAAVPLGSGAAWDLHKLPADVGVWDSEATWRGIPVVPGVGPEKLIAQLGTLGGGNHFIELATDQDGGVHLLVHSGSRGTGAKVADHYIKAAQQECARWWIDLQDPHLAYLPTDRELGQAYLRDMTFALDYAAVNRSVIGLLTLRAIETTLERRVYTLDDLDVPHNYARMEQVGKHPALVTRKGAISARAGERGIVPGSMGTPSYLVVGKGTAKGLQSAPHGAGRPRSRTATKKLLSLNDLKEQTVGVAMLHSQEIVDEAPGAYKAIEAVMEAATDLVDIERVLRPLVNVKGGK